MGLLAALLWGGTDFLVGLNARAVGVKRAVYFGQALGFVIMTLLLIIFPALLFKSLNASMSVWLLGIAAALFTVSGALALSKAFALGKAAIVAPLVTSYGVVTTLLSWASGEHISLIQLGCIALCVIGVILSSIHKDNGIPHNSSNRSVAYAMLAALLYGTSFWLQGRYTLPALGPITMLWLGYHADRGKPDEPGWIFGVFVGSDVGVGVGGDGDQYVIRRDCGDLGVCVFQGAVVGGAGAGGCAGAGRGGGPAYRRLTFHAQKSRPLGAAF
jgi:uncharacterized membrane protein